MSVKRQQVLRYLMHIVIAVYGVALLWLYYKQSIAPLPDEAIIPYQSDLPLHISMIVEDGWYYSFTAYAYKALHVLCGGSTIGIALLLAIVSVATVYATEQCVCFLGKYTQRSWFTLMAALSVNLVMPIYIQTAGFYRYVSFQCANVWHNSTYVCMKLFALVALLYYFKLEQKYREGISFKEWLTFAVLQVVTTGIKPSFLLAFSPIMGMFLLVDLFEKVSFKDLFKRNALKTLFKKIPLKQVLVFGSTLLPSGLVILWQNAVLFGETTGNGIELNPWYTFSLHARSPKLAVLCSAAFCIVVVIATFREVFKNKIHLFVTSMSVLGFFEALCLVESGTRSVDGNFLWGYSFCLFVLFLCCLVKMLRFPRKTLWQKGLLVTMSFVYFCHLYCGIQFFIRLVCGESYWMKW